MKNLRKVAIVVIAVFAGLLAASIISFNFTVPKASKGDKTIELTVQYNESEYDYYKIDTDSEYLKDVLDDAKSDYLISYDGYDGDYGFTLTTVNDVEADCQSTWWIIYVDGEFGMYSLDKQPAEDGHSYKLSLETY